MVTQTYGKRAMPHFGRRGAAAAASSTVAGTGGGGAQLSHDGVTGVSDARQDDATEDEVSKWLQTLDAKLAQYAPRFHEVRYLPAFFCRR